MVSSMRIIVIGRPATRNVITDPVTASTNACLAVMETVYWATHLGYIPYRPPWDSKKQWSVAALEVCAPRYRAEWLAKITEAGVRRRAKIYYQQFDVLAALRQEVRRELLAESRKHPAMRLLQQIPSIGHIRAALLIALMQTPHRFRTKRQLWAYCGLALRTYDSGEYRFVGGQLKRSKKAVTIRGLNKNHNHDLKNIFKGAATRAAATAGPLQNFYEARIANGMKPPMARLTLARKIAAITLLVWKKGVRFDAEQLKQQAA